MKDFFDQSAQTPTAGIPGGGYCLLRLKDVDQTAKLVKAGAHSTATGEFVCIHAPAEVTAIVEVNGKKEGGEFVPARLVFLDENGHNVTVPIKDDKGHGTWQDVVIFPQSPLIESILPLSDPAHLPPNRVVCLKWFEARFGKKLPQHVHDAHAKKCEDGHGDGMKAGDLAKAI